MSTGIQIERDERTEAVENASYKWAYSFVSFALLGDVVWRSVWLGQAAWDLMFLVVFGGGLAAAYQQAHHILGPRRWMKSTCVAVLVGLFTAAIAVLLASWLDQ